MSRGDLADFLLRVETGWRPPTRPWPSVVPQPPGRVAAIVSLPGHVVVAADVEPEWVRTRCPEGDLSAPLNPPFLHALERRLDRRVNSVDMLLLAPPAPGYRPVGAEALLVP